MPVPKVVRGSRRPGGSRGVWTTPGGRQLGLLDGSADFSPPNVPPGAQLGRIEIVADGVTHVLTGEPTATIQCIRAPCVPPPGSPEAFGAFWEALADIETLAGASEVGEELAYRPAGFALLIGVVLPDAGGLDAPILEWPIDRPLAAIGRPVGCAAAALRHDHRR